MAKVIERQAGGWEVVNVEHVSGEREQHVLPWNDLKPHAFTDCWCNPRRDTDEPSVVIHNSMDRREKEVLQ